MLSPGDVLYLQEISDHRNQDTNSIILLGLTGPGFLLERESKRKKGTSCQAYRLLVVDILNAAVNWAAQEVVLFKDVESAVPMNPAGVWQFCSD